MKKITKALGICALACSLAALAGCSGAVSRNPYQIASSLGQGGDSAGSWMTQNVPRSSEAKLLFEEAKEDGYTGSFVEFLKEINYRGGDESGVNAALTSAVDVVCYYEKSTGLFGSEQKYASAGAGVIYSLNKAAGSAYILTNYHVVHMSDGRGGAKLIGDVRLNFYGSEVSTKQVSASYVGGAMNYDIAVLKVEDCDVLRTSAVRAITPGDSDALCVGETVYALGNPDAAGISATKGIVSVDAEYIDVEVVTGAGTASLLEIRTDTPINHGNSGGGLFNPAGELVGITNARSEKEGVEHFGYAIPSNLALAVAQNIIDNAAVNSSRGAMRATLGVTMQVTDSTSVYDEEMGRVYVMETVTVQDVSFGSVAYGKLKAGDVLYSARVGDREKIITRMHMLSNLLFTVRKGDVLELTVSRGEEVETVRIDFSDSNAFTLFD